jgi:uncharacterized protein (DUF362 family)
MDRRTFLRIAAAATASPALAGAGGAFASGAPARATVTVVHGKDARRMLEAGMKRLGGFAAFVKTGAKATVKVNAAWASRPEQGGNTSPEIAAAVVAACRAAGASEVVVPEKPCDDADKAFKVSGLLAAVEKAGGRMVELAKDEQFRAASLPKARTLTSADVAVDVLDTGCLVNVPVAKSHGSSGITCAMKNWMGSVDSRKWWHLRGLDQCIADMSTLLRPALIVADATRVMLTEGPRGPGKMSYPGQIILGTDPVAVDAYAATLFGLKPFAVPSIRIAHEMGVGVGDLSKVEVVHVQAG